MTKIAKSIRAFVRNEDGASLAEYGLLVGLIAVVCIIAIQTLGVNVSNMLGQAAAAI